MVPVGGNLFFQLVNARYEKGAMILTSNRGFAEWVRVPRDGGHGFHGMMGAYSS